jgi:MFS family permease
MEDQKSKPRKIRLSRCYRLFLFFIMASIEAVMNIANGLLSSATKEVKKSLNMNDAKFGSFGTANSLGRIMSSTLFGMLNQKISRKWSTTLGIGFHAIFILCFHITNNANILIFVRGLHGFTQMPPSIYVPVWIDQYAIRSYRTVQLTTVQLSQTIGKCIGYLLNMYFGLEHWKKGFLVEAGYLIFCTICCLITSEDYFSMTLYRPKLSDEEEKNLRISCTIYEEQETNKNKEEEKKSNFFDDLKILSRHSLYVLSVTCRCILHGINTCLHFWLADFLRTVIHEQNQLKITIYYSIICLAGPVGGMIANAVLKPIIISYESRRASWPLVILQLIASLFGISIGFMKTTLNVTIATILFLMFNSSALPIVQGILISCVGKKLGTTGFAIANILTQVLTSGTTPLLYGIINDRYKDKYPNLAMLCIMSLEFLAIPFLCILAYLRNKKFDEEEKNKEEKEQELVDK